MSDEQMTTADKCKGCVPAPVVTAPVTRTPLWDHPDLEIPDFLRRKPGETPSPVPEGSPFARQISVTAGPAERGDYGINRYRPYETDKDRAERAVWLAAEEARIKGNKQVAYVERDAKKRAEQEALRANKLKQRAVFVEHFKWDWEK